LLNSDFLRRMHPRIISIVIRDRHFWEMHEYRLERKRTKWNTLCICTGGSGVVSLDAAKSPVRKGDLFTTKPGCQLVILTTPEERLEFMSIQYSFHVRSKEDESLFTPYSTGLPIPAVLQVSRQDVIREKFENMLAVWKSKEPDYEWLCQMQFMQVLDAIRQWTSKRAELPVVRQAIRYMNTCLGDPRLNRELIAEHVSVAPGYLSVLFRKQTGYTFGEYLAKIRIDEAKAILSTSSWTISEIARAVGFSDSFYFSRVFKRHTGLSPSEFRKC
jgi:YesN/AraC family two-component response regulator